MRTSYLHRRSSGIWDWAAWAFCWVPFSLSWFPARWASFCFPCAGFSLHSVSIVGAFTELGSSCAWPPPWGDRAKVVSARLHLSHGSVDVRGVCDFLGSVSSQQKFEVTDIKALGQTVLQLLDRSLLQLLVTAQLYLENKGKYTSRREGMLTQKTWREEWERERDPQPFGSSFYMFFSSPLGLPYVNWASQECCLFSLRSSPRSSDLPLFYFHGLFPSLSFSHRHSGLLFPILTTWHSYVFGFILGFSFLNYLFISFVLFFIVYLFLIYFIDF